MSKSQGLSDSSASRRWLQQLSRRLGFSLPERLVGAKSEVTAFLGKGGYR